jgi:hypothetical protein
MWVKNADGQWRTGAVKLSVRYLGALALVVALAATFAGSQMRSQAAVGTLYVSSEYSNLTTESPAPSGKKAASSVYITTDTASRVIASGADKARVVLIDPDLNVSATESLTQAGDKLLEGAGFGGHGSGDDNYVVTSGIGETAIIVLDTDSILAGDLAYIKANTKIWTTVPAGENAGTNVNGSSFVITDFFDGTGAGDPWIKVVVNAAVADDIERVDVQVAAVNVVQVRVTSELETDKTAAVSSLYLEETGLDTGRFEGIIKAVPGDTGTSAASTDLSDNDNVGSVNGTITYLNFAIRTNTGPITITHTDNDSVLRTAQVLLDVTAPTVTVGGPNGTNSQDARPTFTGSFADSESGLDISTMAVAYDGDAADAANATPVVVVNPAVGTNSVTPDGDAVSLSLSLGSIADGVGSYEFSVVPSNDLPQAATNPRNHVIDWFMSAYDMAGNGAVSDMATTAGIQLPSFKVDQVAPSFSVAAEQMTGKGYNGSTEVENRSGVRVTMNDDVANVENTDFQLELDNGVKVVPSSVTVVNTPSAAHLASMPGGAVNAGTASVVYLTFDDELVSTETPVLKIVGSISDLAGNSVAAGSQAIVDAIAPVITVTMSDGSGGSALTKNTIKFTITSDELLAAGSPVVTVYDGTGAAGVNGAVDGGAGNGAANGLVTVSAQGVNTWAGTWTADAAPVEGSHTVVVTATDKANPANVRTVGSADDESSKATLKFSLDTVAPTLALGVSGGNVAGNTLTTDDTTPVITFTFTDANTVSLNKVTLGGTDITSSLIKDASGKKYYYSPTTPLAIGTHAIAIAAADVVDAAGVPMAGALAGSLVISARGTFNVSTVSGWNAISFPSDPVDADVNSVFSNATHDAVLGFDASVPGQWVIAVRDAVSGKLVAPTEAGLTSVSSAQAYWVHSTAFDAVSTTLTGGYTPSDGAPPALAGMTFGVGFAAVPVVDTSKACSVKAAATTCAVTRPVVGAADAAVLVNTYLPAGSYGRVYVYDPLVMEFAVLASNSVVNAGGVLFVEFTKEATIYP